MMGVLMARKSKTKSASKKAGAKKRPKLNLVQGIGVVSTIYLTREMKKAFRNGVNDNTVVVKFRHASSYKTPKLRRKINRFDDDSDIGLIVTVGGAKVYRVAKDEADKPFLSLLGVAPPSPATQCYGGMTLNSVAQNSDRIAYIVSKENLARTSIALLHNPNSAMASQELTDWSTLNAGPVVEAGKDGATDENDSSTYEDAFSQLPTSVNAVVVSADPFFLDTMDELVDEANKSNRFVCYPLQDYKNALPAPAPFKSARLGPDLMEAYTQMGQLAKLVLSNGQALNPLFRPAPSHTEPP
jgi:hypothetical protein